MSDVSYTSPDPAAAPPYAGLVSIVLPTHNRAHLIGRAIESVLGQTYRYWELFVVDDASTDRTTEVVGRFTDSRIAYIRLPINCGHPSRPRNIGWTLARGAYIAYIDDDNAWRPRHLEHLVAAAAAHPEAAGAYGGRCIIQIDGSVEDILDPDRDIDTGDGLHRRDIVDLLPEMWTERNFTHEDKEFWNRLRERHPVGLIWVPEVLSDYYVHADNRYFSHWLNLRRYDDGYFLRNARFLDDPAHHAADAELVTRFRPRNVLDIGCGRGWTVRALRERGIQAWGADPARGLPSLTVIPDWFTGATADRLPFADHSFDVVLCSDVLAHIPEAFVARSLSDIVRVCGGYFVATVDCVDPTREGHLTIRSREWWSERFREAGLQPIPAEGSSTAERPDRLEVFVCRRDDTVVGQGDTSLPTFEHRNMAAEQFSRV